MNLNQGIKALPQVDRPYEKCELLGVEALSDSELLAVILRSGIPGKSSIQLAQDILYPVGLDTSIAHIHQ